MKLLLDTDIGSDIDDAICLAYLLSQPECELLGITTVTGESEKRARLARFLCQSAGKEIPIFPGCEKPLLGDQKQPYAPQAEILGNQPHQERFAQGQAVEFLRQTIRRYPGEITLLTIGPLTNIGLLFALDAEVPSLLERLVMMAGVFTNRIPGVGPREWNALVDPYATAIVYQAPVKKHYSIGLDVTCQVKMKADQVRGEFQKGLLKVVLKMAEIWFRKRDIVTFHDPLAAVSIFHPGVCSFQKGQVEVELTSRRLAGLTYWTPVDHGPHQVALEVDPPAFFDQFFSVFPSP
ncbi:MAG: nucleoside hydrolase [Candidatus Omnitrophica bacterium]|nr:nucleoside hydrolase [Candidatus Omnitrophota bacterium]